MRCSNSFSMNPPGLVGPRQLALVVLALALCAVGMVGPATAGIVQLQPIDDSYVNNAYPNSNYGASTSLYVGDQNYNNPIHICRTYLKFELGMLHPLGQETGIGDADSDYGTAVDAAATQILMLVFPEEAEGLAGIVLAKVVLHGLVHGHPRSDFQWVGQVDQLAVVKAYEEGFDKLAVLEGAVRRAPGAVQLPGIHITTIHVLDPEMGG